MEEQLELWSARLEALKTHAGVAATPEVAGQLERWHEAEQLAAAKLAELKGATGDAWDVVKLEMEKAWHAIELALNEGVPGALSRLLTKAEIESLTPEQQDAILEAMVIAVVADGKVGQDEIARFDKELAMVPWTQPRVEILKKAQAARARVEALANDDERRAILASIVARVPKGPIAEKTFGMMALVMTADGPVNVDEKSTLTLFARAFGISKESLAAIASSLRGG